MPLSWTQSWELPGQWILAPPPERDSADEEAANHRLARNAPVQHGSTSLAAGSKATSGHEPVVPVTESGDSVALGAEQLFEEPWPAYGVLRFSPEAGLRMNLFGPSGDPFARPTSFALWGETLAGRPCSLLPARIDHESGTLGAHARREVIAGTLVLGAHLRDVDELRIDRALLRFIGLREFLWHPHRGPIGMVERERSHDAEVVLEREVSVPGARLIFRLAWEGPAAVHERARVRSGEVEVLLVEPATFTTWMRDWVQPLRDLLVFAMREPSRPEAFTALFEVTDDPLWWRPQVPARTNTREVELVQRDSLLLLSTPPGSDSKLIFSLGELGEHAESVLEKWFAMHRQLDPTAEFLFGALNTRLHLANAVLNLTSAAEGYHRAFHNEQRLTPERHAELTEEMLARCATGEEKEVYRKRIEHAIEPSQRRRLTLLYRRAATVIPQRRVAIEAHVNQLIETRNYFVHHDVRHEDVREGDALSLLLQRLVMVLHANLLLDLGWPEAGAAALLGRSYEGQRVMAIARTERP